MFKKDLGFVEKTITDIAKQTAVMMAINLTGVDAMINADTNMITRNLKRGTVFYLGNELEKEVLTSSSNFRDMNMMVAIDDSFYNAVVSGIIEQANVYDLVESVTSKLVPQNNQVNGYITSAVVSVMMRYLGDTYLSQTPIRNISHTFSAL